MAGERSFVAVLVRDWDLPIAAIAVQRREDCCVPE